MNKVIKKIICIISTITLCGIYAMPTYAIQNNDTMYCKADFEGVVYRKLSDGEEKNEDIPIDTNIKYYLDGNEISAKDLKGKTGKVKIELNFTNKDKKQEEIDGKQTTMYVPYLVACGMILDNEKFQNVTISSGKVLDNGESTIAIGIGIPGMQESLAINDIEIPENITLEADASDFELGNIYMYIDSNVFNNDLEFLDEFDDLYKQSQELKNASNMLVDGSKNLKSGSETYAQKIGEFNTGLKTYADGVNTVSSNYTKINEGIYSVNENTKKIADGTNSVSNGIKDLKGNLGTLITAINSIKKGTDGIDGGLKQMSSAVENSINELSSSTSEGSETSIGLKSLGKDTTTSIETLKSTKQKLESTASKVTDEEVKAELETEISSLDKQISSLEIKVGTERAAYNKAIKTETTTVLKGLNDLKTSLETLQGVSTKVTSGIDSLVNSSPKLQEGLNKLESGSEELNAGANSLSDGTNSLSNGASELKNGIDKLNSNTNTIKESSDQLQEGANTLYSGASTLSDGMNEFDNSGINTIYNFVNGDIKGAQTRLEKLSNLAKNNSKYKYILKVDNLK